MQKFNINDYDQKYVMHCKTQTEADEFTMYLDSLGFRWFGGLSYLDNSHWSEDRGGTCYRFHMGMRGQLAFYTADLALMADTIILEFSDFEWSESSQKMHISFEETMKW